MQCCKLHECNNEQQSQNKHTSKYPSHINALYQLKSPSEEKRKNNFKICSIIPSCYVHNIYSYSRIRYARCCSHYDDFRYRHKCLVDRLLSQGYIALRLEKSFKKFYGRYQDLIEKYQRSVNVMVNDSFPG